MTVIVTKDAINLREKLSELDKETGIKGEELMRADTSAEAREALQLDQQLFTDFESTGIDDNSTSTAVTIDSSGYVGIGTSSPSQILHVAKSGNAVILIEAGNTSGSFINFADTDDTNIGQIRYDHSSNFMSFKANDSEAMRIDASGHAIIPNGVTLGTAVGTYNAANTLDDYEEGTWTAVYSPSVSSFGTITMTTYVGDAPSYVKIGRMVTVTAVMSTYDLTVGAASGNVRISGLPFTIDKSGAATISDTVGWAGQNPLSGSILGNDDITLQYRSLVDGDDTILNVTDLTTGSGMSNSNFLKFTLTYMTDA